jgi:hypothetical protein
MISCRRKCCVCPKTRMVSSPVSVPVAKALGTLSGSDFHSKIQTLSRHLVRQMEAVHFQLSPEAAALAGMEGNVEGWGVATEL